MNLLGFSPCGRVMDYLRSCYSTQMRYEAGDPTKVATVRWYFADPNQKGLSYPHCFGSLIWFSGQGNPLVGEVEGAKRVYAKGQKVGNPTTCAMTAPADWWINGQPPGTPALATAADGTPLICLNQNMLMGGGLGDGPVDFWTSVPFLGIGGGLGGGAWTGTLIITYSGSGGSLGGGSGTFHSVSYLSAEGGCLGGGSATVTTVLSLSAMGGGLGGGTATESTVSDVITGTILGYAGSSLPSGYLWCDGSYVSQTTYAALYAVCGSLYGSPIGGNFPLPDLRGRVMVAPDPTGVWLPNWKPSQGQSHGEELHLLTGPESGIASHTHLVKDPTTSGGGLVGLSSGSPGGFGSAPSGAAGPANASTAHNNLQPVLACQYIIKT